MIKNIPSFVLFYWVALCAYAGENDALRDRFRAPPDIAKPRVYWQWVGGNVTKEGIRRDLEWMKRIGIGGVHNFDVAFEGNWGIKALEIPTLVQQPVMYLSPQWRRLKREAVTLADFLGLEFTMASEPGWSVSGGPWVKPYQAMKKFVWSETVVQGGRPFKARLPLPPQVSGPLQNIPAENFGLSKAENARLPTFYADVATIAYRDSDVEQSADAGVVTSNSPSFDAARLSDGDLTNAIRLSPPANQSAWIQFTYPKPRRIQAITAVIVQPAEVAPVSGPRAASRLEASADGRTFRKIVDLPRVGAPQQTISFAPVVAPVFRVVFENVNVKVNVVPGSQVPPAPAEEAPIEVAELMLHSSARVSRWEDKAGFSVRQIRTEDDTPAVAGAGAIRARDVIDLTGRMSAQGSLDWTPPAGRWRVMRVGYSLIGRLNHPAPRGGSGLEADKLSREYARSDIEAYLDEFDKTLGADLVGERGLRAFFTESYEVGPQNWTDHLPGQFRSRRGYDLRPWLPVLTGRVVESAAQSDRFLWDYRRTLEEMLVEHYGQIAASLHARHLSQYAESQEVNRAAIGDGMEMKKAADIPMGAMWVAAPPALQGDPALLASSEIDLRESASVAHVYGKDIVAAESFTTDLNPYRFSPQDLKPIADWMMALGVNRFVIHASVHQPDARIGPGLSLGSYGQWFTRKETWADQAGAWIGYLTRSSYLLQQGRFLADIAYLYGEDTNLTSRFDSSAPPVPEGYGFDFVNPQALLSEFSVKDGRLVTRAGMTYRVLALDAETTRRLSVPVLRKLRDLVRAGAVVVGPAPIATPSLADDEEEFRTIVRELWGVRPDERGGEGRILPDAPLGEILLNKGVTPDVELGPGFAHKLRFVHRTLEEGDLYFIQCASGQSQSLEASFRVSGRKPELWRADTGAIAPVSYRIENGRTIVPMTLGANDAVFVVFRKPTTAPQAETFPESQREQLAVLDGPWDVRFPPGLGAPEQVRFDRLDSWTESRDSGVKYFSGVATYVKALPIRREWLKPGSRLQLDLGAVASVAEVVINGRSAGVAWKKPFTVDITNLVREGTNRLEVKVANLWPNRLIGDKQPGARKIAYATFDPFKADSPLLRSGLLGPVALARDDSPYVVR